MQKSPTHHARMALVETGADVEAVLAEPAAAAWLALTPAAMHDLDQRGLPYTIPEEHVGTSEVEACCLEACRGLQAYTRTFDSWMQERWPLLAEWGLGPASLDFLPLLQTLQSLARRRMEIEAAVAHLSPDTLVYVDDGRAYAFEGTSIASDRSITTLVMRHESYGRTVERLTRPRPLAEASGPRWPLRAPLRRSPLWYTLARAAKRKRLMIAAKRLVRASRGRVLVRGGYEWELAGGALDGQGFGVVEWAPEWNIDEGPPPPGRDFAIPDPASAFPPAQVALARSLFEREVPRWDGIAAGLPDTITRCRKLIARYHIGAVLTDSLAAPRARLLASIMRSLGTPIVTWQHGFSSSWAMGATQFYARHNAADVDLALVYGPGVVEAWQHGDEACAPLLPVGSAQLAQLTKAGAPSGSPTDEGIVYATTNYYETHWYLGFSPPFSDRTFCQDQGVITRELAAAARAHGKRLTIKLNPSPASAPPPWAEGWRSPGVRVVRERPDFVTLLRGAGIVVLDFPSTVVLQAINTRLPVFVLMRHWNYRPEDRALLARRAMLFDDAAALIAGVAAYLAGGTYDASIDDRAFVRRFGTNDDQADPAEAAVAAVEELLARSARS